MLSKDAARHLTSVLRSRSGDQLTLFNGDGSEYGARLLAIGQKKVSVQIESNTPGLVPPPLEITLAIGMSKGDRMDWVIQKAVELGITKIMPLFTERSAIKLDKERAAKKSLHWKKVACSACEQSGQNLIPAIDLPATFEQAVSLGAGRKFILDPVAEQSLVSRLALHTTELPRAALIISGPEGGFSRKEIQLAERSDILPVQIGPRILRTETAPIVAISLLQAYWGDYC